MRDVTDTVRRTVLRPLPPGWGGLEHAGVYLTADAQARVGGDFYDIQPGPHGTRVFVGDVQGKGLGAVETAAVLLGTFREAGYHEADLGVVADRLESRMVRHRAYTTALGRADGDRFATAVLLAFPRTRTTSSTPSSSRHEPPLAVGPSGCGGCRWPGAAARLPRAGARPSTGAPGASGRRRDAAGGDGRGDGGPGPGGPLLQGGGGGAGGRGRRPAADGPGRLVLTVRDRTLRHCRGHLEDDTTVFAVRRGRGARVERREGGTFTAVTPPFATAAVTVLR